MARPTGGSLPVIRPRQLVRRNRRGL